MKSRGDIQRLDRTMRLVVVSPKHAGIAANRSSHFAAAVPSLIVRRARTDLPVSQRGRVSGSGRTRKCHSSAARSGTFRTPLLFS